MEWCDRQEGIALRLETSPHTLRYGSDEDLSVDENHSLLPNIVMVELTIVVSQRSPPSTVLRMMKRRFLSLSVEPYSDSSPYQSSKQVTSYLDSARQDEYSFLIGCIAIT